MTRCDTMTCVSVLDWENPVEQGDIVLEYFKILDIMGIIYIYISYVCIYIWNYMNPGFKLGQLQNPRVLTPTISQTWCFNCKFVGPCRWLLVKTLGTWEKWTKASTAWRFSMAKIDENRLTATQKHVHNVYTYTHIIMQYEITYRPGFSFDFDFDFSGSDEIRWGSNWIWRPRSGAESWCPLPLFGGFVGVNIT